MDVCNRKVAIAVYAPNVWMLPLVSAGVKKHLPGWEQHAVFMGQPESWGKAMLQYCNKQTEPFLLLLDDYAVIDSDTELLLEACRLIEHAGCVRLMPCPGPENATGEFGEIKPSSRYSVSLQPSIWRPEALASVIRETDSPWDVEIKGSERYAIKPEYATECATRNAISYCNILRSGYIVETALREAQDKLKTEVARP